MTFAPVKIPLVAKKMFPNYVWDIPTKDKILYLTFDDGPTPEITDWTLNTLKAFNAKATFFCIGKNIANHPDIFQNVLNDGHAIGNHTYNHIKGWKTKAADYLLDIKKTQDMINSQMNNSLSSKVNLFRPPYGQITPKQGKELMLLGYKIVMWDIISFDWDKTISEDTCLKNVISKSTSGSVIVFHDSVKASKNMQYTLPKTLEYFSDKGYNFRPLIF
ncbi:polysaccharide deacetylase family protein [Confluentibacter sediminis]|uniref:polysaccharide deacetylase family protein n=1 Tax=Confluentibacter sediminis TaxID=2219045 RepID=UPI000DACA3D7|nr:polysaccharide deacetylase family protein [Confluentibacter sediminis]